VIDILALIQAVLKEFSHMRSRNRGKRTVCAERGKIWGSKSSDNPENKKELKKSRTPRGVMGENEEPCVGKSVPLG